MPTATFSVVDDRNVEEAHKQRRSTVERVNTVFNFLSFGNIIKIPTHLTCKQMYINMALQYRLQGYFINSVHSYLLPKFIFDSVAFKPIFCIFSPLLTKNDKCKVWQASQRGNRLNLFCIFITFLPLQYA